MHATVFQCVPPADGRPVDLPRPRGFPDLAAICAKKLAIRAVLELAEYATLILEKTMNREFTLTPKTEFAPARRSAFTEVEDDFKRICACELVAPILDAMGEPAALLNENRQVVFANTAMCELGGVVAREEILGLRLGEVLG